MTSPLRPDTDNDIAAGIMRKILLDPDFYRSLAGTDFVLDGNIDLTETERAWVERFMKERTPHGNEG